MGRCSRLRRRCFLYAKRYALLVLWTSVNSIIFWTTYYNYKSGPQHYYLHQVLGSGLCVSRATAAVLNFNCFVVVLPMCRSVTSVVGSFVGGSSIKSIHMWTEIGKSFHTICAVTIVISAVAHSASHIVNAHSFSYNYSTKFPEINVASYRGQDPLLMIMRTVPGVTGLVMVVILCLLTSSSLRRVRITSYDLFWYIHRSFLLFLALLLCHPMGGLLKEQSNLQQHTPGCLVVNSTSEETSVPKTEFQISSNSSICHVRPKFIPQTSETWKWITAALFVYGTDFSVRLFRRRSPARVLSLRIYGGCVLELRLSKAGFKARPGQYVLLQCPAVSSFEWHPFTVTSCPTEQEPSFTLHIRTYGDWSHSLKRHLLEEMGYSAADVKSAELVINPNRNVTGLYVDGPFFSSAEAVTNYRISVCIAGGIGVTPFVSFLKYLRAGGNMGKLHRLHFIWICRELETFHWFADLLCELHRILWDKNRPDFLDIQLYLTCPTIKTIVRGMMGEQYGLLETRLHLGRPNWKMVFKRWIDIYERIRVGVFCCGPRSLHRHVARAGRGAKIAGGAFVFHKESFS